jgi:chromosome partitioning protein
MSKVIAVANRKGGVGKTTMSVHIAVGLATKGYNVGLIDTDFQGHSSLLLKMTADDGLFRFMVERAPLEECLKFVPPEHYSTPTMPSTGRLFLIPSSNKTAQIAQRLHPEDIDVFHDRIQEMVTRAQLDIVILDTAPSATQLDSNIYLAADGFVFVTEIGKLSFDGLKKLEEQIARSKRLRERMFGEDTRLIGVIPNKLRANTVLHQKNVGALQERYGETRVWDPVRLRIAWEEAAELNETVYVYAPNSYEMQDAIRITQRVEEAILIHE